MAYRAHQVAAKAPAPDGSRRRAGGGLPTRWVLAMNVSFFQELLGSIAERGRALIERAPDRPMADGREAPVPGAATIAETPVTLEGLCRALLSGRGEASGVALARRVLDL